MSTLGSLLDRLERRLMDRALNPLDLEPLDPVEVFAPTPVAIYVHVPFCGSFCSYCSFNKYHGKEQMAAYASALQHEIGYYGRQPHLATAEVSSIMFGGGTPSYPPADLIEGVLDAIEADFVLPAGVQITLEANPESASRAKLERYRLRGVNRISLGVQSFDDERLRRLGRRHRITDIERALDAIGEAGFEELSLDLMFGLPGQTFDDFAHELRRAIATAVTHISLFPVIYQRDTPIARERPTRRPLRKMYYHALDELSSAGFVQYTTEDFTRGAPCDYHLDIWRPPIKPCLGFGAGALASFGGFHWHNIGDLDQYIAAALQDRAPVSGGGPQSARRQMHDHLAFSAKTLRIDRAAFEQRFGVSVESVLGPVLPLARVLGLITTATDGALALTRRGSFYASRVWCEFVLRELSRAATNTAAVHGPA